MKNPDCPCKRTSCERHGYCEICREHHHSKSSGKSLTRCEKLVKKKQRREERAIKHGR